MRCPSCGGFDHRSAGPGEVAGTEQFTCVSELMRLVPTGAHPGGGNAMRPQYYTCGHRFIGPSSAPADHRGESLCGCGIFAVGACRWCSAPVCQRHLTMLDDRVACATCSTPESIEARAHAARDASVRAAATSRAQAAAAEQARAANRAAAERLTEARATWWRTYEELIRSAAPFDGTTSHLHFIREGHLLKEDSYAFGSTLVWDKKDRSRRVTDFSGAFATVKDVTGRGSTCPLHGAACTPKIKRQGYKPWSVTFTAEGWKVGSHVRTHHDTGRGGGYSDYAVANILTAHGTLISRTTDRSETVTRDNFAKVLDLTTYDELVASADKLRGLIDGQGRRRR